jgi:hypothetical protein
MAAATQIIEKNGAGGTATDKTSGTVRFKRADNSTVDLVDPIPKPASGSNWSFQKLLRLNVTGGSYTSISNLKAYTDGSSGLGAGINLWAKATASYATPALETASTGYANAFTFTSGAALSLGAGPFSGVGEKGDHLQLALEVTSAAAGGLTASETLTLAWDEI